MLNVDAYNSSVYVTLIGIMKMMQFMRVRADFDSEVK